jgi:hypothetical protein
MSNELDDNASDVIGGDPLGPSDALGIARSYGTVDHEFEDIDRGIVDLPA